MKEFSKDTKDCIEQLYSKEILKNFPNYANFWSKFIGVKITKKSKRLLPYGLKFSSKFKGDKKQKTILYERLTMAHYHIFCSLASAHEQLKILNKSYKIKNSKRKYFKHWEAFDLAYSQLGTAINQVYHLWGCFFLFSKALEIEIRCKNKNRQWITKKFSVTHKNSDIKGTEKYLRYFLSNHKKRQIYEPFSEVVNEINIVRNNIVHFSKTSHISLANKFHIPIRIKKNILWSRMNMKQQFKIPTDKKLIQNIEMLEKSINELHTFIIIKIEKYLKSNGIFINYQNGKQNMS